ncbi:hypothetical protein [Mycolicibacterium fortuitum]|uniref:hypothetical protein n=1 Tax=Mycolicibacterium fortuitum TaxID=1766 RepID=UPI0026309E26|nr:hypothetical protein [Mycolicibacterium fortuitum]
MNTRIAVTRAGRTWHLPIDIVGQRVAVTDTVLAGDRLRLSPLAPNRHLNPVLWLTVQHVPIQGMPHHQVRRSVYAPDLVAGCDVCRARGAHDLIVPAVMWHTNLLQELADFVRICTACDRETVQRVRPSAVASA